MEGRGHHYGDGGSGKVSMKKRFRIGKNLFPGTIGWKGPTEEEEKGATICSG